MLRSIFGLVRSAILGIIVALILTSMFQPSRIQGTSMEPSVMNNNLVLLNKASYWMAPPAYGDIVVFKANIFTDNGEGKMLVKRVIGIENDEIEILEGRVYRNGRVVREDYAVGLNPEENMEKIKVAEGRVFVLGDHRDVSLDSRDKSIGQVQVSDIVGKVAMRIFPFSEIGAVL